ncbi:uncharacterized protein conserved in bacteria [Bellilinea caldifistulae]|uniref:DUF4870 domain-containing protein n=1 Tax=Bellilinea caldifistulae TaxID=360411 RepID=UPI000780966B|nr:DUF4870 domain-containing protein [Bellilinea caldifistulae]GAP08893.1 uncharacterized protein conserved in bacteria [Bellilinea caldifistulae]
MSQNGLSSDERWLAALAHASILIPTLGFAVPLIVWITQREKSVNLRFQALQALTYQLLLAAVWVVLGALSGLFMGALGLVSGAFALAAQTETPLMLVTGGQFLVIGGLLCLMGLGALLGVIGGIACLSGSHFRYPLLGRRMESLLLRHVPAEEVSHA